MRVLGLRPGEGEGNVYLMTPYDPGVFYAPIVKRGIPGGQSPAALRGPPHHERRGREQADQLRREAMGF